MMHKMVYSIKDDDNTRVSRISLGLVRVRVCSKYWKFVGSSHSTQKGLDQCAPRVYGVNKRTQKLKD
jgi:hypothetical protein